MCVVVVQDVHASPRVGESQPPTFELALGWCWIPKHHKLLRFLCCYILSLSAAVAIVILFAVFFYYEFGASMQTHGMVYARLISLFLYAVLVYALSSAAQSLGDDALKSVATFFIGLFGMAIALIFLRTEKAILPLLRGDSDLPGDGFSTSLNHLLMMAVDGVTIPPSTSVSQRRFLPPTEASPLEPPDGWDNDAPPSRMSFTTYQQLDSAMMFHSPGISTRESNRATHHHH